MKTVIEAKGDLLYSGADFICHQTNFHGVMGGGVALAIRRKMLSESSYKLYADLCMKHGRKLLGTIQHLPGADLTCDNGATCIVINMFCQDDVVQPDGGLTSYEHMHHCLQIVENIARTMRQTVAIPGYIGCGIAGGDWNRVKRIIYDVFGNSSVKLIIVYRD